MLTKHQQIKLHWFRELHQPEKKKKKQTLVPQLPVKIDIKDSLHQIPRNNDKDPDTELQSQSTMKFHAAAPEINPSLQSINIIW